MKKEYVEPLITSVTQQKEVGRLLFSSGVEGSIPGNSIECDFITYNDEEEVYSTKVHKVIMPQILAGRGETIEQGGSEGGGHHGMIGNSMDIGFSEE